MPSRDLSLSLPPLSSISFASNDLTMGEEETARGRSQPHSTKTFRKITNFPWKRGNPSFIINTGLEESCRLFRGNNVSSRGWLTGLSPFFNRGSPPISIIFSTHHYGRKSQGKSGFTSIRSVHFYESHPSPILLLVVRFCFNTRFFCKICLYLVIQFLPSEPLLRFSRGKSSRLFISDCVPLVNGIRFLFFFFDEILFSIHLRGRRRSDGKIVLFSFNSYFRLLCVYILPLLLARF